MRRIEIIKKIFKYFFVLSLTFFVIYQIILICRIFFYVSCIIPSDSMQPTLIRNDYIYVSQRVPGPRILKYDPSDSLHYIVTRKKGKREILHNDILLFNSPWGEYSDTLFIEKVVYFIKRCIAVPGDTIYIDNGIYRIKHCEDTLGYYPYQLELSLMDNCRFSEQIYNCFPHDSVFNWNIKNFGVLYVPKHGDRITIDSRTIKLYKNLIEYETGKNVSIRNDSVFLNYSFLNEYLFIKNYYFMAGDYVFNSIDSRYWGLLPEDHIIGKALFIWKSIDPLTDKYRFKRFFKKIV